MSHIYNNITKAHLGANLNKISLAKRRDNVNINKDNRDFPSGPVGKTPSSQKGAWVRSLVRGTRSRMSQLRVHKPQLKDPSHRNDDLRAHVVQLRPKAAK